MKRIILSVVLAVAVAFTAAAGDKSSAKKTAFNMGVEAGLNLDSFKSLSEGFSFKTVPGWHAGLNFSLKLPLYFAIQPSVQYEWGRSQLQALGVNGGIVNTHSIVVPVAIQWGPDLGAFRPYLQLVPMAQFNLAADYKDGDFKQNIIDSMEKAKFGVGVGAGIELWRLQLSARYNWLFGDFKKTDAHTPGMDLFGYNFLGPRSGVTITLSIFFL